MTQETDIVIEDLLIDPSLKQNKAACSACQGICCKQSAGIWHPDDLGEITEELLLDMIDNQGHQLDSWEGDAMLTTQEQIMEIMKGNYPERSQSYFIRPRHTNSINKTIDRSFGGVCSFLTRTGCKLPFESRPSQCRELIPSEEHPGEECTESSEKYEKRQVAIAWLKYEKILLNVVKKLRSRE